MFVLQVLQARLTILLNINFHRNAVTLSLSGSGYVQLFHANK